MAMINCKECNAEVSDSAYDCPNCGATLKKLTRSLFGKIIKWGFILFNILMLIWVFAGVDTGGEMVNNASNSAEAAGAAIGTGLGIMMLITVWVLGDIILGIFVLLTRPSKK